MSGAINRRLIITADDLGYSTERNKGVVECFRGGAITRSSLMVNSLAANEACALAKQCGLPLGLHLNMTEGFPISKPAEIQSLLNSHRMFHSMFEIRDIVKSGKLAFDQVRAEIKAQIDRFRELTGCNPLYVDGHQHVHVIPGIAEIFAEELAAHKIAETRLPLERDITDCEWVEKWRMDFFHKVVAESEEAARVYKKHGVKFPDGFVGMVIMDAGIEDQTRVHQRLLASFQTLDSAATSDICCEFMVHPGYPCTGGLGGCGAGPDDFSRSEHRHSEMLNLLSSGMLQFYKDNHMTLVSTVM